MLLYLTYLLRQHQPGYGSTTSPDSIATRRQQAISSRFIPEVGELSQTTPGFRSSDGLGPEDGYRQARVWHHPRYLAWPTCYNSTVVNTYVVAAQLSLTMGRKKSVPGPLTLTQTVPEPRNPAADSHVHSVKKPTIPTQQTQTQHRLRVGETDRPDQVRLSPPGQAPSINSLSPKSPRSPYTSKFSPKHLISNSSYAQSQSPRIPSPSPSASASASASAYPSHSQNAIPRKAIPQPQEAVPHAQAQPQQQQPNLRDSPTAHETKQQPHIAELQQRLPPITRAATSSPHPPSNHHHHHQERRLKSSHGRRHEERSNPNNNNNNKQGFFFSFHKSAKSSDRLPPPPTQTQTHKHTHTQTQGLHPADSARAAMNGIDQPPVAKQSSKQSGKK